MFTERKLPLWARLTSGFVIGALLSGCMGKTFGTVTPTAESASPTPMSEPYCDSHMLTIEPPMDLDAINPYVLPIISENLMGPSGVGRITGLSRVTNPSPDYVSNVKKSAQDKNLPLDAAKATVVEFGMEGDSNKSCAPLTMILGEEKSDGTQPAYLGFATEQIDSDQNGTPDLDVLVPSFDGNIDTFLPLGQVDANPGDSVVHVGTIDQLDPNSISPIFEIDQESGKVTFYPPFYQGEGSGSEAGVQVESAANFVNVSYKTEGANPTNILTPTPSAPVTEVTVAPPATETPEASQFQVCSAENYANCAIPSQDLFNGNYLNWLKTLQVEQFDPAKVEQLQCFGNSQEITFVGSPSKNNFANPDTAMVKRGFTFGVVTLQPGEVGYDFPQTRTFLILPAFSYSKSLNTGVWNLFAYRIDGLAPEKVVEFASGWAKSGNLMVMSSQYESGTGTEVGNPYHRNPLVVNTFNLYPDMQTKLDNFGENCDPGYISDPGIILETSYTR